jgi:hypothetical protein
VEEEGGRGWWVGVGVTVCWLRLRLRLRVRVMCACCLRASRHLASSSARKVSFCTGACLCVCVCVKVQERGLVVRLFFMEARLLAKEEGVCGREWVGVERSKIEIDGTLCVLLGVLWVGVWLFCRLLCCWR